jgi:hypothetical protein
VAVDTDTVLVVVVDECLAVVVPPTIVLVLELIEAVAVVSALLLEVVVDVGRVSIAMVDATVRVEVTADAVRGGIVVASLITFDAVAVTGDAAVGSAIQLISRS